MQITACNLIIRVNSGDPQLAVFKWLLIWENCHTSNTLGTTYLERLVVFLERNFDRRLKRHFPVSAVHRTKFEKSEKIYQKSLKIQRQRIRPCEFDRCQNAPKKNIILVERSGSGMPENVLTNFKRPRHRFYAN